MIASGKIILRSVYIFSALTFALDMEGASVLQLSAASYGVAKNAGQATIIVQRTSDVDTAVSVEFTTADQTALAGADYLAVNGTLVFEAGITNQTISIPILNDAEIESAERFQLLLSNPSGGGVLGNRATAYVVIQDNDWPLAVEFATYRAREGEASVVIGVVRSDDGEQTVTVGYATASVTATPGVDYTETAGTLTFAPGEKVKLVEVPILNDSVSETNKTFRLSLTNAIASVLGSPKSALVTLQDNDPGVQFTTTDY